MEHSSVICRFRNPRARFHKQSEANASLPRRPEKKGFLFALDDFGSSYNSFHYLSELTFDYVKIDGEFIRNMNSSPIDHALVSNLVPLCREIGTSTVAEFVETEAILSALQEIGVDYVQGHHIGHPSPHMD